MNTPTLQLDTAHGQRMQGDPLPVVLIFKNIAADSNINFTFTTAGTEWSLGARSGDSMGFTVVAEQNGGQRQSCIRSVEFSGGLLAIRTASGGAALNAFTMTLFLRVAPGVDYLQGYCTLNNEASVMAFFGSQRAMEWRNGRISAVLRDPDANARSVIVSVQNAYPGDRIALELSTKKGLGLATWCLGPGGEESGGIRLAGAQPSVPLKFFAYGTRVLEFETSQSADAGATLDFFMQAYLSWQPHDLPYIYLKATCDPNVSLFAHIGNRQPQLVSQTFTVFTL